jgi:hypothetical protein
MKRPKGPEIKLPKLKTPENVKAPKFLADLYHDLDERHLLPVVAILVVAIIAIPMLLGGSSDSADNTAGAGAGASASAAPNARPTTLVVAKSTPRLRDYRRRLGHLRPKDPFKPHYTQSSTSGEGGATASAAPETPASTETTESSPTPTTESGNESSDGGASPGSAPSSNDPKVTFLTYAIDVRVVPVSSGDGKPSQAEPTVRHDLPPLVMLPSRDKPALIYVGPSRDGKKAMMLVSNDVTALFGDSKCILGSESCQMLALEPGLPETIVFGPQARTYRVELLKIQIESNDHLNRAALGKPKNKSGSTKSPGKFG